MTLPKTTIYITGGKSRKSGAALHEWNRFESARLLKLELPSLSCKVVLDYQSPPEICPDESQSHVFKAGHHCNGQIFLCTQTEVLILDSTTLNTIRRISLPFFNDLHHVRPDNQGNLLIANTGLDMVARVSLDGTILDEWSVFGSPVWDRHDQGLDYRKVLTTKPHPSHPNFVFVSQDQIWATRHFQKDAVCLDDPKKTMNIEIEKPHDGEVLDGKVFFTTVDGQIIVIDERSNQLSQTIDLREIYGSKRPLGFCRGLKVINDTQVMVGFSRLRGTKFQKNLAWVKDQIRQAAKGGNEQSQTALATRVALIDLKHKEIKWEIDLEPLDVHAVFSII
jgi:hypothetical protein